MRRALAFMKRWFGDGPRSDGRKASALSRSDHSAASGTIHCEFAYESSAIANATRKNGSVRRWNEMPLARMAVISLWCESRHIV